MSVLNLSWAGSFPFCLIPASGIWAGSGSVPDGYVGPGTEYPVGLSLDQAMRWYWQVQTWECTAAFAFSGTRSDGGTPPTFSDVLDDTLAITRAATQSQLVCPTEFNSSDALTSFEMWGSSSPYAYSWDGLIYPFLVVVFADSYLTITTDTGALTFPKPWPGTLTLDGQSVSLWYDEAAEYDSTSGVPGDHGPWTQSKSGSATVTAAATY